MKRISKKHKIALEKVDNEKFYSLDEAIKLAKEVSYAKFDETIDLTFNLNLNTTKAEQQLRGAIELPHGTGKNVRILVAAEDPTVVEQAKAAGADLILGGMDLKELLDKGDFSAFDIIVTEPKMMPSLGRYGKILGPKGLMPNPKTGTVTVKVKEAVESIKKGQANYRTEKAGLIHTIIGKVSMEDKNLEENANVIIDKIKSLKPDTVKGTYMLGLTLASSMGPSIKVKIV